ncbi:MAG TPA: carboxypeptidase regulatory-like domain-containing protein [Candidatus Acidoferrales bacterium]|nr:carboxypeptidase regulatory-like domain-containing protein [Candidatus Acidoferrales bacterium]
MRMKLILLALIFCAESVFAAPAQKTAAVALAGRVSSDAEGAMEGVLVRAKGQGKTISITVVTDREGRYSFPASRLAPGKFSIDIRAIGYDIASPLSVEVAAGAITRADLKLVKTRDLVSQLTSSEWLLSVTGTEAQKNQLFRCAACHSLAPIVQSTYDEKGWLTTFARMRSYSEQAVLEHPVSLPYKVSVQPDPEFAKYLSTINLNSTSEWKYELKTLPRPTGRATRVIVTEYDLPDPGRLPHDADLDDKGMVWYNDFREPLIGRLDPRTGETKEWRMPPLKPGFPEGTLSIEFNRDGYLWIPRFRQGGYTRFDPRKEEFKTWPVPPAFNDARAIQPQVAAAPDGTAWFPGGESLLIFKVDPATELVSEYPMYPDYHPDEKSSGIIQFSYNEKPVGHSTYGLAADSKSNIYICDIVGGNIGKIDGKTGKVTLYKTPTLNSGPRRVSVDSQDRVWFGEYYANKIGMFDPKTEQFKEWTAPTPWVGPYPAKTDKNGDAWTAGMSTDLILRLDPESGKFTEYMLPTVNANIRHIDVDNSTSPVAVWVAEVHQGKIAKIEPLD